MTFEEFHKTIIADELWVDAMRNPSRGKDLKAAIEKVYGQAVSDGSLKIVSIGEHRKHVFNTLGKMPLSKVNTVQLQQTEKPPEKLEVKVYATDEQREYWLNKLKEEIKEIKVKPVIKMSHKEIAEEGDWIPKKRHVPTDPLYFYENQKKLHDCRVKVVKDRHPDLTDEQIENYIAKNF